MIILLLWAFIGLPLFIGTIVAIFVSYRLATDSMAAWLLLAGAPQILVYAFTMILICLCVVFLAVIAQVKASQKIGTKGIVDVSEIGKKEKYNKNAE